MNKKNIFKTITAIMFAGTLFTGCKKDDKDSVAPTVTVSNGSTTYWQKGKTFTDPGATASDDKDGTLTANPSGTVNINTVGTYVITYTAIDAAGNKGTGTRTVYVVNFDGNYTNVQSGCTDPAANGTGTSAVNASLVTASNGIDIQNFGLYANLTARATFSGNTITIAKQASSTGVTGDQIEGTGTITGTGVGSDVIKFTITITERSASNAVFNTGKSTLTHN